MAGREFTREAIIAWVKRQLGFPVVEIELTDDQLEDCIDNALDEIAPWVVQRQYVTLPASQCMDLSPYNVAYVITVHKADGEQASQSQAVDVFNPLSFSVVRTGVQNFVYTQAEMHLFQNMVQNYKDNISYKFIKPKLYLDIGYPEATRVTIEYSPEIDDLDSITDKLYQKFVRRFSLAYARAILSDIRGKFSVSGSPVELDGGTQESKSEKELELIRQELKDTVTTHFMID